MSEELKDFETIPAPTLTLEPFGGADTKEELKVMTEAKKPETPVFDESSLTPQEQKQVEEFAMQIDLTNSSLILQYGVGAQKKMADFSESALENVRTKDLGEVGEMLTEVVTELRSFDTRRKKRVSLDFSSVEATSWRA